MTFRDRYEFDNLVNEAEKMVIDELERQLSLSENRDVCTSGECVLDMAAYALNLVPATYRVNLLGRLYADALDREHAGTVRAAVTKAIAVVRKNPPA